MIKLAKDPKAAQEKLDDNDAAYLAARYDAAIDSHVSTPPGKKALHTIRRNTQDADPHEDSVEAARKRMSERNASAWRADKKACTVRRFWGEVSE